MILSVLVDYNDCGILYSMTVETENKERLFQTLHKYSRDVRFVETKQKRGAKDRGKRVLSDGSIILRCKYFGDKVPAMCAFAKSPGKMNILDMGVVV